MSLRINTSIYITCNMTTPRGKNPREDSLPTVSCEGLPFGDRKVTQKASKTFVDNQHPCAIFSGKSLKVTIHLCIKFDSPQMAILGVIPEGKPFPIERHQLGFLTQGWTPGSRPWAIPLLLPSLRAGLSSPSCSFKLRRPFKGKVRPKKSLNVTILSKNHVKDSN